MNKHFRVMLASLLIMTGVLVVLPSGYVGAAGMVSNGDFEQGEGEVPSAWNVTGDAARVDTGPIYAGNWSAIITGSNDQLTECFCIGNLTMPVTFEAWGWIRVSGEVTGIIGIDFWAGVNGTQLSSTTILSTNDTNNGYAQVSGLMQSPMGANCTRIRLWGTDWHDGAEVRFDDIGFYAPMGALCFIATAAYGTETAAELDTLRDFRDQVLLKSALGSLFVEAYYRVSPPIADFIAKNDFLRAIVREVLLDPVVRLLQWSQGLWRG